MSKQVLIGVIALCAIVVVVGYGMFSKEALQSLTGKDASILLYVTAGDVSYKNDDGSAFQKATTSPVAISEHALVYTGKGEATILFPNNSTVTLDEYTELAVNYSPEHMSFLQTLGTTYHRVEALISGSTYEVETPGTVASVRGTKFAVKFDKNTKTTKVAVTEHVVEVAKVEEKMENGTTTRLILESKQLTEGNTANISATTTGPAIQVGETSFDADMNAWVEENKVRDAFELELKESNVPPEKIREEIMNLLERAGSNEGSTKDTEAESKGDVQRETSTDADTTSQVSRTETKKTDTPTNTTMKPTQGTKSETKTESKKSEESRTNTGTSLETQTATTVAVKKVPYERFFDTFNALYFDYFYLDENDLACQKKVTPNERVRVVTSYATESSYPFSSKTLAGFADAVGEYCGTKDASVKARLQGRFDEEFPYQENI